MRPAKCLGVAFGDTGRRRNDLRHHARVILAHFWRRAMRLPGVPAVLGFRNGADRRAPSHHASGLCRGGRAGLSGAEPAQRRPGAALNAGRLDRGDGSHGDRHVDHVHLDARCLVRRRRGGEAPVPRLQRIRRRNGARLFRALRLFGNRADARYRRNARRSP